VLIDYAATLEAKGNVAAHNHATVAKVSAMLTGRGFAFLSDVDPGKVSGWLAGLRRPGQAVVIPPGDGFSSSLLTARYTHRRLHDRVGAVQKLPKLVPDLPTTGQEISTIPFA